MVNKWISSVVVKKRVRSIVSGKFPKTQLVEARVDQGYPVIECVDGGREREKVGDEGRPCVI